MSILYDVEFNSAAFLPAASIPEMAERAEAAGFSAVWKGESNSTDPIVLLSAIAARTSTIQLGTAINHVFGRSPVAMGIQAATLQDLSGGRLLLGLGVANRIIAAWHGDIFDRPLRRIREYVEIVRQVAAGERVEYQGEVYSTDTGFKLAWKPSYPAPPIYFAALRPQLTHLTGRIAEGVIINMASPEKVREIIDYVREGAVSAGRDPSLSEIIVKVRVSLHPDRAVARQRLRQVLGFYNVAEFYSDMLIAQGFKEEVTAVRHAFREGGMRAVTTQITDAYMDRLPVIIATSIEEVRERLQPFVEAGATRLVIPYVPSNDAVVEDTRSFLRAWETAAV